MRDTVWDTHLIHGSPVPYSTTKWSLVFSMGLYLIHYIRKAQLRCAFLIRKCISCIIFFKTALGVVVYKILMRTVYLESQPFRCGIFYAFVLI